MVDEKVECMERSKNYSRTYRALHWSIAIVMILLMGTIFLRLTWMEKNHVAEIIQEFLAEKNVTLSGEELIVLAKQIRQPMWIWHIYFGYALIALFTIRFTLPFFGEMKFQLPFGDGKSGKEKFQAWTYLVFYAGVIVSLVTGMVIKFGPKEMKESMESIHELSLYYLLPYIFLHMAGVFFAEFKEDPGIISRIVRGK